MPPQANPAASEDVIEPGNVIPPVENDPEPEPEPEIETEVPENPAPSDPEEPEDPENPEPEDPEDPNEPPHVKQIRSDLASAQATLQELQQWKQEQERVRAEQQAAAAARGQGQEWTEQQWQNAEKAFGFQVSKDEEGRETVYIDRRQMIREQFRILNHALQMQERSIRSEMQASTADSRVETTVRDLELRKTNPLKDIRQFMPGIRQHLTKWFKPEQHADPEVLELAYNAEKGRRSGAIAQRAAAGAGAQRRVIHPAKPASPAKPAGSRNISGLERQLMAGYSDEEWLAARDGR